MYLITDGKTFDTNVFFSGGAGMFLQYHDIVKPVYLYAIAKMIATKESFGLPISIISNMSAPSIIEWYVKRRYKNPFQQLDYDHIIDPVELNKFLAMYLEQDPSIYKIAPPLNIQRMLSVYQIQHMSFPVYVYSENEESYIKTDCKNVFPGVTIRYVFGDLRECIKKCDQNFTYIFSDIELVREATEILQGTCSHVLLARDYRYNFKDHCKTPKYDLTDLARSHPYVRMGTTLAMDPVKVAISLSRIASTQGG